MTHSVVQHFTGLRGFTLAASLLWPMNMLAAEGFEFGGYWRAGYNTASTVTAQELVSRKLSWKDLRDSLQGLTGEASDTQDLPGLLTTRHAHSPTYFLIKLSQRFSNGTEARFAFDSFGPLAHEVAQSSADTTAQTSANLRVRDLFLSVPLEFENTRLWAGSRMMEFEELRLFEGGNPFDLNAFGVGVETTKFQAVLSYNKASRTAQVVGPNGQPVSATTQNAVVNTKDVTVLGRWELPAWKTYNFKPMFKLTNHSGAPADLGSAIQRKAINGSIETMVGTVIHRTGRPGYLGHSLLAFRVTPSGLIGRTDQNALKGDENTRKTA